jgi:hypothetical protein
MRADRLGTDGIVRGQIVERLSSESTTPQPNVSSGLLRSITTTSYEGSRNFMLMAK